MLEIGNMLSTRFRKALPQAKYFSQLIEVLWSPAKRLTCLWFCILVVASLLPIGSILLLKRLVDGITTAMKTGMSRDIATSVAVSGASLAAVAVFTDVLSGFSEWVRTAQTEYIQDHVSGLIQQKSVAVDYAFYETPDYYDRLYRARDEARNRIPGLLEHAGSIIQNCLTLAALCTVIATYNGTLLIVLALSLIPAFFVIARFNWLSHQWWSKTTEQRRWLSYYDEKFSNPSSAAEIRLLGLGPRFQAAYSLLRKQIREAHLALVAKQAFTRGGAAIAGIVIAGIPVTWIAWQVMQGKATFGDMVVFYQAFVGGQAFVRMVTVSMAQVYSNSLYLTNLCEYLALQPAIKDPALPAAKPISLKRSIQFRNVSFQYPGSDRPALCNLDLTIPAGKIVAVVGPNGAGKSTLIKLLSRFYDPADGAITIDQISLSDYAIDDIRSFFSVLFQMPVNYDATAAENISFGDLSIQPIPDQIVEAAKQAGADDVVARLPAKYDTALGKSFSNGTDLSAGEWQRIAMARAFFRQAPVVLLDEPTSFMDPWSEASWFEKVRKLSRNRTAVIVTHRFSIAMRADLIYVMQKGRVVESGTHYELTQNAGLYAQSWKDQLSAVEEHSLEMAPA